MTAKEHKFIETVQAYYKVHGRHTLPWRRTTDPYHILVSELMLQQTQVGRVVPKYEAFIRHLPTASHLARASLGDVLRLWQGLGYNRRAKYLHECAKVITKEHDGQFPRSYDQLKKLPGVGPYTAAAIMNFAYNLPTPLIETNVRTVYLHHFFKSKKDVADTELLKLVAKTIDTKNPRQWFAALMDYGTHLKQTIGNTNTRSKHYTKQSKFKGSDREIRGAILRLLAEEDALTPVRINKKLSQFGRDRITQQINRLLKEELVIENSKKISLP